MRVMHLWQSLCHVTAIIVVVLFRGKNALMQAFACDKNPWIFWLNNSSIDSL